MPATAQQSYLFSGGVNLTITPHNQTSGRITVPYSDIIHHRHLQIGKLILYVFIDQEAFIILIFAVTEITDEQPGYLIKNPQRHHLSDQPVHIGNTFIYIFDK